MVTHGPLAVDTSKRLAGLPRTLSRPSVVRHRLDEQRNVLEYQIVPDGDEDEASKDKTDEPWGQRVLESHTFMNVMAGIIVLNGVIIGLETDYPEFKYWHEVEFAFLCIFLSELFFKMWVEGKQFWHPHEIDFLWNLFDLIVVGLATFDFLSYCLGLGASSGGFATIFRMARLMRVMRIIRLIKVLKPLFLLAVGLIEAFKSVIWVTILMGTVLYVFAVVLVKTVGQASPADPHYDFLHRHFRNIPDCMITLFVLMSSPNLPVYQDEEGLLDSRPLFCMFLIMFICFGSFGMIAMLTGVINESIFENNEVRKHEKAHEHEVMRSNLGRHAADLYETLPLDDRGCAKTEDLKNISEDAASLLDQSGITIAHGDIVKFLELMDDDETGFIDMIEFVHAIEKISEGVSPLAMIEIHHHAALCNKKVSRQLENIGNIEKKLEASVAKTEENVSRILTDITSVQHKRADHLVEKIESQMVHVTDEVDRILQVITDEKNSSRDHLVETIEAQMLRVSDEVDRILNVVTGGKVRTSRASCQQGTSVAEPTSPTFPDPSRSSFAAPSISDPSKSVFGLSATADPTFDSEMSIGERDNDHREQVESQMTRMSEEVGQILRILTSGEIKVFGSATAVPSPAREVQMTAGQLDTRLVEKMESQTLRMSEEVSRIFKVVTEGELQMQSYMQHISEEVEQILRVLPEGKVRVPRSYPAEPSMGDPTRDVQILSEIRRCESVDAARDVQILSEIRRCESAVMAAVSKQNSKLTERVASTVQTAVERKFQDLERQRALKESSDKCVQLGLSSQLQDISASLHKILFDSSPSSPQSQFRDLSKRAEVMESLRSDMAILMQESKSSFVRVAKAQDTVQENVEILTSKVSLLEKETESLQAQVMGSVAELGGDIISSLADLITTSLAQLSQAERTYSPTKFGTPN